MAASLAAKRAARRSGAGPSWRAGELSDLTLRIHTLQIRVTERRYRVLHLFDVDEIGADANRCHSLPKIS